MVIHLSVLLLILVISFFYERRFREEKLKTIEGGGIASDYKGAVFPWLLVFGYIAFLAGMRDWMNDTHAYAVKFNKCIGSWTAISDIIYGAGKDKGFYILQSIIKMVSDDYHFWFFFVAAVESIIFIYVLRREAVSFLDACFFFVTSTLYYDYFSMMRQWLAVAIVFFATVRYLKRDKVILYVLHCLLAAQFHNSAYFMIVMLLFVRSKPWTKKILLISLGFVLGLLFLQPIISSLSDVSDDVTYSYVLTGLSNRAGASGVRILISAVPIILSLVYKDKIEKKNDKMIFICVNMSFVCLLLTVLGTFTSGLYVTRMSVYLNIFNTILYPYILNFIIEEKKMIKTGFYVLYFAFFLYQLFYQGANVYSSAILGVFQ